MSTGKAWVAEFADRLGVEAPDDATIDVLLDLAGVAAHGSERIAAPIACYLVGLAGLDPTAALALARANTDATADRSGAETPPAAGASPAS